MRNFFRKTVGGLSCIYMYVIILFAYQLLVVETTPVNASDRREIYPSGKVVGLYVESDGVFVIDTCEIENSAGEMVNPTNGKIKTGDYIISVNGVNVREKEAVSKEIELCNGEEITLTIKRNQNLMDVVVSPALGKNGEYRLGVWVKDDLAGVGTITYVTEEGKFGSLGHGMNDGETNELMDVFVGEIYVSKIKNIQKGKKGEPGQIKGVLYYGNTNHLGEIEANTDVGIYGAIDYDNKAEFVDEIIPYEIAYKQEIEVGVAQILSNISGEEKYYDIEITYVDYLALNANKGLHIKVTDPELLSLTGGIVQGMSGSPIIQNGRIVGAVTHVLINNPEKGYGIFIETMLEKS